jgi:hypothetical protein
MGNRQRDDKDRDLPVTSAPATRVDGPETMRRAIRGVTLAQLLVAKSQAARARRAAERVIWQTDRWEPNAVAVDQPPNDAAADAALRALRSAVGHYVKARRDAGDGPGRAIASLKAAVSDLPATDLPPERRPLVVDVVVPWAILEYFDTE